MCGCLIHTQQRVKRSLSFWSLAGSWLTMVFALIQLSSRFLSSRNLSLFLRIFSFFNWVWFVFYFFNRLIVQEAQEYCLNLYSFSPIWISGSEKLTFPPMENGIWTVIIFNFTLIILIKEVIIISCLIFFFRFFQFFMWAILTETN